MFVLLFFFFGWMPDSPAASNATNVNCVTTGGGPCNVLVAAMAGLQVGTMVDNIWLCSWSCLI